VGTDLRHVSQVLTDRLKAAGYAVHEIHISRSIIPLLTDDVEAAGTKEYARVSGMMDRGNLARKRSRSNAVLALGAISKIAQLREPPGTHMPKAAYIVSSLKHPEEVACLRQVYPLGFYLLGVHADIPRRLDFLTSEKLMTRQEAFALMERDQDEHLDSGQRVADTFHLSDFFVHIDGREDPLKHSIWRIVDLLFGDPFRTPTFDEYAMFLAFAASLRSADLSRQVGAVIAREYEVLATGANDCPKFGGGLHWPEIDDKTGEYNDMPLGRDYTRGKDMNKAQQAEIIDSILQRASQEGMETASLRPVLEESRLSDLTEFGRVVHAEMEAILACARNRVGTEQATLYCTTFPCHNCAKHIIAAGIERVVFVEPYEKSKALDFHVESLAVGFESFDNAVQLQPFVGVGPRRFFDLFSMRFGSGYQLRRKQSDGNVLEWHLESARLRLQMLPTSYLDAEAAASKAFLNAKAEIGPTDHGGE
jgi:deoxycytidylate deaminase